MASAPAFARRAAVLLSAGLVLFFYWWTVKPAVSQLGNATAKAAYYNLLTDGWRAGNLHINAEPNPALATLANPYDPLQNGPYRLHDASYYKGKYYLYFGPVPALVLFLPWAELTGRYIWHNQAVAIFASAAFLVYAGLLCAVRRRYFPRAGPLALSLAVLVLGLANGIPVLLRRPDVWEIPIACGAMFIALVLAALWRAVHERSRRWVWIAVAAACYGLAIGARPSLLPGLFVLAVPFWVEWRQGGRRRQLAALAGAAGVPLALAAAGLMAYNFARFGSVLEFGQRYQLTGVEDPATRHFGLDFVAYNFRVYFLAAEQWQSYFPFVRGAALPVLPPNRLGEPENPYGVLTNLPVAWLALLALPAAFAARASGRGLGTWLAAVALVFAASAGTILCFAGACNRYEVDFLPGLTFLSAAGIVFLEDQLRGRPVALWLLRPAWAGAALYSCALGALISFEHWGLLRLRDPASYSRLAAALDRPVAWVEDWRGRKHGALELRVVLPPFTGPRIEPLLVTGYGGYADYVWIHYDDATHVTIGFEHTGYGGPVAKYIPVDYSREHILRIEMGSLYPPADHPFFRQFAPLEGAGMRSALEVQLDDRILFHEEAKFYDASPLTRWVGANPFAQNLGHHFSGEIRARRTLSPLDPPPMFAPGPAYLTVTFPREPRRPAAEPLVVTGRTGKGDILFVRYVGERQAVVGIDHWGYGGPVGEPFAIDPDHVYRLDVRMGSLYPSAEGASPGAGARDLEVRLDDKVVLSGPQDFHPAALHDVYFGWNPIGGSTTAPKFSGRLTLVARGEKR